MKSYCLGYTHDKCESCQKEKNWQTLNMLPDALRRSMQKDAKRINISQCRLTKMGEWEKQS